MKKRKQKTKRIQPFSIERQIPWLEELNRRDQLSIFVGAGISASCGLPDWDTLKSMLKLEVESQDVVVPPSDDVANIARRVFGSKFNAVVADCLYREGLSISKSALAIANSGIRSIVCFNFDDILEEIYQSECIDHSVVLNGERFNLNNKHVTIFHPHGYVGRFDSEDEYAVGKIVLSESDYKNLHDDHYCLTNLIQLSMLITKTVLFVGMSMTDPNTLRLLKKSREVGVRAWHYALMVSGSREEKETQTKRLRRMGVDPVWYQNHSEIPKLIESISK